MTNQTFSELSALDLDRVVGGTSLDDVAAQAAPFCPDTVARYTGLDQSKVDRSTALKMGDECLAEGQSKHPLKALVAKKMIADGINKAFPQ